MEVKESTKAKEVDTKEGYDQWSSSYEDDSNPLIVLEEVALSEMLPDLTLKDAVDLGCGTGRNSKKLRNLGARVHAVDFSEGMLEVARRKYSASGIIFERADLQKPLAFPDKAFDLVLCTLVIEHIQFLPPTLREMGRICRTKGQIIISDLHPAMKLKDAQAHFTDPMTGIEIKPKGFPHSRSMTSANIPARKILPLPVPKWKSISIGPCSLFSD